MTKELGVEKIFRERAAVDDDEGPGCALRCFVNGARHELFASAGFAVDEDARVHRRDARERGEHFAHHERVADEPVELRVRPRDDGFSGRGVVVDVDRRRSHANVKPVRHARPLHLQAIDESSVLTADVAHPDAIVLELHLGMKARDHRIFDDEIDVRRRAEQRARFEHVLVTAIRVFPVDPRECPRSHRRERYRLHRGFLGERTIRIHQV